CQWKKPDAERLSLPCSRQCSRLRAISHVGGPNLLTWSGIYHQHDRDEMEVLFTFLSERYERKSVLITTNLVFSEWNRIFKDPMTTLAAIDRVVHHSVILDLLAVESYRAQAAHQGATTAATPTNPTRRASATQPVPRMEKGEPRGREGEAARPLTSHSEATGTEKNGPRNAHRQVAVTGTPEEG